MQKLIYNPLDSVSFALPWVRPHIDLYFELVPWEPGRVYEPDSAVLVYYTQQDNPWYHQLREQGHAVVIDHLWDSDVAIPHQYRENAMELRCGNWMWYLGCWEFAWHGYQTYQTQRNSVRKVFLMLMNNPRWHRGAALSLLEPVLHRAIYSYRSQGIHVENDKSPQDVTPWQRYMNPSWYNGTAFSAVMESYMRDSVYRVGQSTEVSEKIFKPLAYRHPFVVAGSRDTLKYLHSQGFETFDTWFDQSYDSEPSDRVRLARVCDEIHRAVRRWDRGEIGWDSETVARLEHNHNHFFSTELVNRRFEMEVVNPIKEFLCRP